jgi:hypothetical protein
MVAREQAGVPGQVFRVATDACASAVSRDPVSFTPGISNTWTFTDGVQRNAGQGYYWLNYGLAAAAHELIEKPDKIVYQVIDGSGAARTAGCAGDVFHIQSQSNSNDAYRHYLWTHEFGHTISKCAMESGDGCDPVYDDDYRMMEAFTEGAADFTTLWLTKGRYLPDLLMPYDSYAPEFEWGGADTTTGDSYMDDYEMIQLTCTLNGQCTSGTCATYPVQHIADPTTQVDDTYKKCSCTTDAQCGAGRLCHPSGGGWCRLSCPHGDHEFCRTEFGVSEHAYCVRPTGMAYDYCYFHGKFNNRMLVNAWNRLKLQIGWERAVKYVFAAMSGVDETTTYQEGADSHYEKLRAQATYEKLETAKSFASVKPTFSDWPDDQTNNWWVAPHLNSDGPYANELGVPWDDTLANSFNFAGDTDYFSFRARPGESYRVWSTYTSAGVDLCISIYEWSSAHTLVARDDGRCFDGSAGGSDLTWAGTSSGGWYQVRISNEAGGTGTYRVRLQMQNDDHVDYYSTSNKWRDAEPISHGQLTAIAQTSTDNDYFKIYVPNNASITYLDIYVTPSSGNPQFWLDWGEASANPNAPVQKASQTGNYLRYNLPANEREWYYIEVAPEDANSVSATLYVLMYCGASVCGNEHDFGSRTNPFLLDLPWGNTVAQWLYNASDEDWYAVDLTEADHFSANAFGTYQDCSLDIRLYADEEQTYYNCDGACTVPSGSGTPQYMMRQVGFGADAHATNLHYVAEKDGRYYIRISSGDGSSCDGYTLSAAKTDLGSQTNPLWDYETPDFQEGADA